MAQTILIARLIDNAIYLVNPLSCSVGYRTVICRRSLIIAPYEAESQAKAPTRSIHFHLDVESLSSITMA